ncbi:MAG: hypothetical protein OEU94_05560 [Aquincola sp.]|nr:hypothetical protein [Aquincola sp.]MDH4287461.1 hypothetical protein [Aquincola sp.]MDH5331025.1 hypothetical protein [Aquincola sp.]
MKAFDLDALVGAVQRNCDVADARHATELTLCIYLLQMRELYRWEQGLPLGASLRHRDVGDWLDRREALWDRLAGESYTTLPIGDECLDPFDAAGVNQRLLHRGWVYGAGRLASGRPVFLLARLHRAEQREGLQVLVAARELARGLAAPPGALSGRTVLLRREALLRWLWEMFEAWSPKHGAGPFSEALAACGHVGGDVTAALERLADEQLETLWLHELGEHRAGEQLGPGWAELRMATGSDRHIEPRLRALRDHLADCLVTLPALRERASAASLHLWFANLDGVRLEMFPRLQSAYAAWRAGDGGHALDAAIGAGRAHWQRLGERAIALHRQVGANGRDALAQLLSDAVASC